MSGSLVFRNVYYIENWGWVICLKKLWTFEDKISSNSGTFWNPCPVDPDIKIIDTVNGSKNAIYMDGGTEFLIHSKYNPEKEAERLVSQLQLSGSSSIVIYNFLVLGMGYHLKGFI